MRRKRNSFSANYAIPPGETLRETLNALGVTRAELGRHTGGSPKYIKEIVGGKRGISKEIAVKLDQALEIPASFWINLEKNYRKSLSLLRGGKNGH